LALRGSDLSERALWTLHKRIWTTAFRSLGRDHKMDLYRLDSNVTIHPQNPALWFYPDADLESAVSSTRLTYAFPADEFKNPVFAYVVVHHWFRMGLGVGAPAIREIAASKGLTIELPTVDDELTSSFVFKSIEGRLHQLHDGLSLLSEHGWRKGTELSEAVQAELRAMWEAKECHCPICWRVRPQVQRERRSQAWDGYLAELRGDQHDAVLLDRLLGDTGPFPAEVRAWIAKNAEHVIAADSSTDDVLVRHLHRGSQQAADLLTQLLRRKNTPRRSDLLRVFGRAMSSPHGALVRGLIGQKLRKTEYSALAVEMEHALPLAAASEPAKSELVSILSRYADWQDEGTRERLKARLCDEDPSTRRAAAALLAGAFRRVKAAQKKELHPLFVAGLSSSDPAVVREVLRAGLRKADLVGDVYEALVRVAEGAPNPEIARSLIVTFKPLGWSNVTDDQRPQLAKSFFRSAHASVRRFALETFLPWVSREAKRARIVDALIEVASETLHSEFLGELLRRFSRLPSELATAVLTKLEGQEKILVTKDFPSIGRVALEDARLVPTFHALVLATAGDAPQEVFVTGSPRADQLSLGALLDAIPKLDSADAIAAMVERFELRVGPDLVDLSRVRTSLSARVAAFREGSPAQADALAAFVEAQPQRLIEAARRRGPDALARLIRSDTLSTEHTAGALLVAWTTQIGETRDVAMKLAESGRQDALVAAFRRWLARRGSSGGQFVNVVLALTSILNNAMRLEASIEVLDLAFGERPHADFLYNKACALLRRKDLEGTAALLARSFEMSPGNRDFAKRDPDFGPYLDHPAIAPLLA
ncbi:MAG: hypothetical protein AAGE52_41415, partial [Myxococcota bacterium]